MAQRAMIRQVTSTAFERPCVPTTWANLGKTARAMVCFTATSFGLGNSASNMGITIKTVTTMQTAQNDAYIAILSLMGTEPSPMRYSAEASATMARAPGLNKALKVFRAAGTFSPVRDNSRK